MDTIFAPATAPGRAGVSIVRISGPDAFSVAGSMTCVPEPGSFKLAWIKAPGGDRIDQALVLAFGQGASFTGNDTVEFHLHGSLAVMAKTLSYLSEDPRARLAEPGEFTRQALENGQMSLVEVEALSDLIEAETEAQHSQAISVLDGGLQKLVVEWRSVLIHALAMLEALIDFPEEDVPNTVYEDAGRSVDKVVRDIQALLQRSSNVQSIRNGFKVVILGKPNVGKSTLLNALAGHDAAITSSIAGTTRDVVTVRLDIGGFPVDLMDTAGLRENAGEVEKLGIEKAYALAEAADVRIILIENETSELEIEPKENDIVLLSKADQRVDKNNAVSGATGQGVAQLLSVLRQRLSFKQSTDTVAIRERQVRALEDAVLQLTAAQSKIEERDEQLEIIAESLYSALRSLEFMLGRVDVEDLLDEIFSTFCMGK